MTRISLRAFAVIASAILIGLVSVVPVWAASYRVFEYFHFEGLPDDHCQIEPTWGPEKTAWQGCNYHASDLIAEAKITRSARDIDVNGVTYTCVGWNLATGSITPASGKENFVSFNLDADSSITWIYKKAHKVSFSISPMNNRLSAWGDYPAGPNTSTPTDIVPLRWDSIARGQKHTLAISQDGRLWAWGNNEYGQLGLGNEINQNSPTMVAADLDGDGDPDSDWVSIAAGGNYSLAIKSDGTLWAWGWNNWYQLGLGYFSSHENSPKQVGTSTNWDSVAAGESHTLALKSDGFLWAWGKNDYGQLGLGHTSNKDTLTQVDADLDGDGYPDTDWISVKAKGYHTLALKSDGTLWAWGYDNFGALGLGDTDAAYTPTQVGTKTDWISVAAGKHHTLALKSDGTLWAWGKGDDGQLRQCTHEIIEETELVCTWVSGVEICETIVITKVVCGDVRTPS